MSLRLCWRQYLSTTEENECSENCPPSAHAHGECMRNSGSLRVVLCLALYDVKDKCNHCSLPDFMSFYVLQILTPLPSRLEAHHIGSTTSVGGTVTGLRGSITSMGGDKFCSSPQRLHHIDGRYPHRPKRSNHIDGRRQSQYLATQALPHRWEVLSPA